MFLRSDDEQLGLVLGGVFGVVAAVVAMVLGLVLQRPPVAQVPAPSAASARLSPAPLTVTGDAVTAPPSAQALADAASITVEYGMVKFYFASGDADLAAGAAGVLVDVVQAARSGRKVQIAGFHDAKGNAAANAELARRRAMVVQDALRAAGVPERQISLVKPAQAGPGPDAEARRVEITLQ